MKILVSGATGFIGSRLLVFRTLPSNKPDITCITRNLGLLKSRFTENVKILKADVMNYQELVEAMTGIDIAFYLIHSMEGSSKNWKKFAEIGWQQKISREPLHIAESRE